MSTPPKRSQRPRRELRSDAIAESSSPSRPSKRRKKTDDPPFESTEPTEEDDSSLVADRSGNPSDDYDQTITSVTQVLSLPNGPVHASKEHANSTHDYHKDGISAYAKIAALDWTYYITKLVVKIGRSSEPVQNRLDREGEDDEDAVHIDLGPSKLISRQHASVYFNAEDETWWLHAKGRNSLKVDNLPWAAGHKGPLRSGAVIEIGGVEMMFVLPVNVSPLQIDDIYLKRAGITKEEAATEAPRAQTRHPLPSVGDGHHPQTSPATKAARGQGSQKTLAPAPPDYKRPGTPPTVRQNRVVGSQRTPHVEHQMGGPVMMNNSDVDLSLDENKHIKPQFSYAQMITQAIMHTNEEKLNLNGIYTFIMSRYSYYRHQNVTGWQNSIRHNLSLNKAFEKVARSTDEPGKGMKWQIVPEQRDEMIRTAYRGGRGGHRGSSNPSSPNQQLNYINQVPRDMAAREPGSARKRKVSPSGSPQPRSALRDSVATPVRPTRRPLPDEAGTSADGSPLPRPRKMNATSGLGTVENVPGSPTLASSFLQEDGSSFVTPAPHRVHPKLAPPSTAQRPSQHMPTSSPAPFWRYAEIGSTPLKPVQFDPSPTKGGLANLPPQSSSPPPPARSKSPTGSPLRPGLSTAVEDPASPVEEEGIGGFDLTKGFQSIGSYHAPVGHGKQVQPAPPNGDTNGDHAPTGDNV